MAQRLVRPRPAQHCRDGCGAAGFGAGTGRRTSRSERSSDDFTPHATRGLRAVLASYVLFGAGYIAYTTFIVAYLRNQLGFGAADVTLFWACVGVVSAAAGLAWGPLLARLSGGRGIAAANAVVMLGAALPVLVATRPGVYVSAVLFGGSFLIVPTSVTTFVRKAAAPQAWTGVIAALTVGFAIGQCIGPWLSGVVSDASYGVAGGCCFRPGYWRRPHWSRCCKASRAAPDVRRQSHAAALFQPGIMA